MDECATLPFDEPEPPEEWRPVVGYEGLYEVSSSGRVRSLRRMTPAGPRGGVVLKPSLMGSHSAKRWNVDLCKSGSYRDRSRRRCRPVHRLVAEAFLGPCPPGMQVLHGPGGPYNNRPENLRWGTPKENQRDRRRDGTAIFGEAVYGHKLTEAEVAAIRAAYASGAFSQSDLGTIYGVVQMTISRIVNRQTWKHVA